MSLAFDFELATFSAAEAEKITGLPQDTQRDWRRRGHLPPISGKARFTVFDLSKILLMVKLAGDMGIAEAADVAELAAATVAANVLNIRDCIAGLPDDYFSATLPFEICASFGQNARTERFLIIWADGRYASFVDDIGKAFAGEPETIFELSWSSAQQNLIGVANDRPQIENCSAEVIVCLLQSGRVSVINLRQFGDELIPSGLPFARNERQLVTAYPRGAKPNKPAPSSRIARLKASGGQP